MSEIDPIKNFTENYIKDLLEKKEAEQRAKDEAQKELVASPAYQTQLKFIQRMSYDVAMVLNISLTYSQRTDKHFKNSLVIQSTDDLAQSTFAILNLVEEGLINPAKRELRYVIESSVKNLYVDQYAGGLESFPELTERLAFLKANVKPSSIDVRNQLILRALSSDNTKQLIDDIYSNYRDCCAYVHVSHEQIEERLKMREKGRSFGFETADELRNIGRLMFRVYDIVLTLYFHGCGLSTTGDIFIHTLDDLTTWKFHKGKYVSLVSTFFNYKYEQNKKKREKEREEEKLWSPRRKPSG